MTPSIRSRLAGSAVSLVLGFAIATLAIVQVPGPDRIALLVVAALLIATAGIGVGLADTRRRLSVWALLGVEAFAIFTVAPLVWMVRLALARRDDPPATFVPRSIDWTALSRVLDDATVGPAMAHSALASLLATLVAVPLGFLAARTIVTRRPPGHRQARVVLVVLILAPLVGWSVPMADQARRLGLVDAPGVTAAGLLVVAIPLATWLSLGVLEQTRWEFVDSVRAAGASPRAVWRLALAPQFAPALLAVAAVTFIAGCLDFAVGAALSSARGTLAVALLAEPDMSVIAAAGLIWLAFVGVLFAVFAPAIVRLVGRS